MTDAVARLRAYWWIAAGAAIALLTWPVPTLHAREGVDVSWQIALHLAAAGRLDFGRDVLFTYGPLGFLSHPLLVTTSTAFVSFAFTVVAQLALCAVLLRLALRSFAPVVAMVLTYAVAAMLAATGFPATSDYPLLLVFAGAVLVLEEERRAVWLVPTGAFLAALALLVKLNNGVVALVLLGLAAWHARPGGWRSELLAAGSFSAWLVVLWVLVGDSLGALPTWLRGSFEVVRSYTDAMAIDEIPSYHYLEAAVLAAAAGALVLWQARAVGGRRGLALAAASVVFGYAYLKEGFVRLDRIHAALCFAALAAGLIAFGWRRRSRWIAAGVVAGCAAAVGAVTGSAHYLYQPGTSAGDAVDEVALLTDGLRRAHELRDARAAVRSELALGARTRELLDGHTVDVEPYETSAIWGYVLRWRPHRLIQSYVATDHELDRLNASRLEADGAERVLRERRWPALDRRHPLYEAPESSLVLLCRYRELQATRRWEVLGRATDRCGPSRRLGELDARAGEAVPVPRAPGPDDVLYARLRVRPPLAERIESLVLKPRHPPRITVGAQTYRLVADVARGPLLLRIPASAGISPRFGGGLDYRRLSVANVASPFRVEFFTLTLRRQPG